MNQTEIHALFTQFAAPLVPLAALAGSKESMETLAKNLWIAALGGEEIENEMWEQMQQADEGDSGLLDSVRWCFDEEMKPALGKEQLAALRKHYGIKVELDD